MLPALIAAGTSILGGILGKNQADKQAKLQQQFAQNGIQWKVEDAKKAGIHPLYALGANTVSYNPVGVGDWTQSIAQSGQDIGRAINASRTGSARVDAYTATAQNLTLRKMDLENQVLAAQLARINQTQTPPFPGDNNLIPGQGNSGIVSQGVKTIPMERNASKEGALHQEAGVVSDKTFSKTTTGWAPIYSKDVMDRMEEDAIGSLQWSLRNRMAPVVSQKHFDPPFPAPGGQFWIFDPFKGEYQLRNAPSASELTKGDWSRYWKGR